MEKLGKRLGFTFDAQNFHNVSLGQGQEAVAEEAMDVSARDGHWVILQNIHLVRNWLPNLEKKMEQLSEKPHEDYRLYISAEPSPDPHQSIIPQVLRSERVPTNAGARCVRKVTQRIVLLTRSLAHDLLCRSSSDISRRRLPLAV